MQGTPQAVLEESGTPDSQSAETFPRSFRIQRSGSADSLASLVRCSSCAMMSDKVCLNASSSALQHLCLKGYPHMQHVIESTSKAQVPCHDMHI